MEWRNGKKTHAKADRRKNDINWNEFERQRERWQRNTHAEK